MKSIVNNSMVASLFVCLINKLIQLFNNKTKRCIVLYITIITLTEIIYKSIYVLLILLQFWVYQLQLLYRVELITKTVKVPSNNGIVSSFNVLLIITASYYTIITNNRVKRGPYLAVLP